MRVIFPIVQYVLSETSLLVHLMSPGTHRAGLRPRRAIQLAHTARHYQVYQGVAYSILGSLHTRGATCAARAPKPGKAPIMAASAAALPALPGTAPLILCLSQQK
jgi:hypothetical protein